MRCLPKSGDEVQRKTMTIMGGPPLSRRAFVAAAGAALAVVAAPLPAAESGGALQIWFIRHAESEINVPGNPRPVPDGGVTYPLTRKGVEQAKALAEATAAAPIMADLHQHAPAGRPDRRCRRVPSRPDADARARGGRDRPRHQARARRRIARGIRGAGAQVDRRKGPARRATARARVSPTCSGASCRSCARS